MSVLTKWLGLPSFLFSVFVFYWSLPIFAILYRIRFASLGKRNDMLDWCVPADEGMVAASMSLASPTQRMAQCNAV